MILTADRKEEILHRARNRTVTAILHLSAAGADEDAQPERFGLIFDGGKPMESLRGSQMVSQTAQLWQMGDTCEPLAERDPKMLAEILAAVARRTHAVTKGEMSSVPTERVKAPFNCEDLVDRATGIPPRLTLTFAAADSSAAATDIARLPFPNLKNFLGAVFDRVRTIGGTLHSVDVAHRPAMTAFDYYEISQQRLVPGVRFSYGDVMLARAQNLLQQIGIPYVEPRKPPRPTGMA